MIFEDKVMMPMIDITKTYFIPSLIMANLLHQYQHQKCSKCFEFILLVMATVIRGRKLINKLVINKLEKFKFFHVGKNNSHPRKNEKNRENGLNFVINFLHYSCVFLDS